MENNKKTEQNSIVLAGVITRLEKTAKVTKISLSTSPSRTKKYRCFPEVVCFGNTSKALNGIDLKDHVEVECAMLTVPYSKRRSDNITSYLVASSVKKSESKLSKELGLTNTGAYDDKNEGVIAGVVSNVYVLPNSEGVIITVKANANGRVSLPSVTCFGDLSKQVKKEQVKKGDIVAMSCFVNTSTDKKGEHRESLVAREFALIERC